MPGRAFAVALALPPSLALAESSALPADGGTPLLWLWIVVGVALVAVMIALLFSASARERGRAKAAARERLHAPGRP